MISPDKTRTHRPVMALVAGLLLLFSVSARTEPDGPRRHAPPALGDQLRDWTMRSVSRMHPHDLGSFEPFQPDARWTEQYMSDPSFIYSELQPRLFAGTELASVPGSPFPSTRAQARIAAWDLGLDRALPGAQVILAWPGKTQGNFATPIAANLEKAGVLPEFYQLAYAYGGDPLSTLNAEMAVALQILHEWVESTAWNERLAMGIDEKVLRRFEHRAGTREVLDQDLEYLAGILRSELSTWRAGRANNLGYREIPTALRIARVAAAYRASQPPFYNACLPDGTRDPAVAGTSPEDLRSTICFTDATDRAVYRWYRARRADQLARFDGDSPLIDHFGPVRPAWAGAYDIRALDWSNHAEIVEAQMAISGADSSGTDDISILRLVERANLLICRDATP